jgi:ParB family transcriptional regulator, chromosome partitioning protein
LRRPSAAAEAYLAMVEENEIRVGLSYYERARIAARATALGVHPTPQAALRALFPTASRAKRSKIGSFMAIHDALDDVLRFAHAIPERLGLALAHALERDATLAPRLTAALQAAPPATEAQELAILTRALLPVQTKKPPETGSTPAHDAGDQIAPGLWLSLANGAGGLRLTLSGPAVDAGFTERLKDHLKDESPP